MNYTTLVKNLKTRFDTLEQSFKDDDNRQATLQAVWTIGQDVYTYVRETGQSIKAIALDVGSPGGTLEKYVRLYKVFPRGCRDSISGRPITLSHYLAVIYIHDKKARAFYLKTAAKEGWSSHELRRRIRNNFYETYSSTRKDASRTTNNTLAPKDQRLYTYAARVNRVIDGDTLQVEIDIGFKTRMSHKVRLRGINCPEKGTPKGDAAKAFVEGKFFAASSLPDAMGQTTSGLNCVIRTYKSGKFGRYIADVWYLLGETNAEVILREGRLLNQELLNNKLAEKVE